jgi:NADPH oxidase
MGSWLLNDGLRWLVVFLWLGANAGLFVGSYLKFTEDKEYYYLRKILLDGALGAARGSAACLNFNCMLVLFPVCRNLISLFRGSCKCTPQSVKRVLDKNITFHIYIAIAIVFFGAVHTGAHMFNYLRFIRSWKEKVSPEDKILVSVLPNNLNPMDQSDTDEATALFSTVAGITGFVMLICLFLMVTSSIEIIRRSYFEAFWYTHHLFVIFFIGIIIHGLQGIVKGHTNPETLTSRISSSNSTHQDPVICYAYSSEDFDDVDCIDQICLKNNFGELLGTYCLKSKATIESGGAKVSIAGSVIIVD